MWRVLSNANLTDYQPPHNFDIEAIGWLINAHKMFYNKQYPAWADGSPISGNTRSLFTNIIDAPNIYRCNVGPEYYKQACYYLNRNAILKAIDCDEHLPNVGYICKKAKNDSQSIRVPCTIEEAQNVACPAGWAEPPSKLTLTPYCYQFVTVQNFLDWDQAFFECNAIGGELLYLDNSRETEWIKSKVTSNTYLNLHRYMYGVSWAMKNERSIDEVGETWKSGEPNNVCGDQDCASFDRSGNLDDVACS